jgi:hypothetical protein
MHRAFDPTTTRSAYCVPSFTTAGCKSGPYSLKTQLSQSLLICKYSYNTDLKHLSSSKPTTLYTKSLMNGAFTRQRDRLQTWHDKTQSSGTHLRWISTQEFKAFSSKYFSVTVTYYYLN